MEHWEIAVLHAFKGERFDGGALDVEVAPELSAYRELIIDVAKHLWSRDNSERQRLPRHFEGRFQLRLTALDRGSAVATLSRNVNHDKQLSLIEKQDVFVRAMRLVEESVNAANRGEALPSLFPRSALAKFRRWGSSLSQNECVELRSADGQALATYGTTARANLIDRIDTSYETEADESGYVLATSIRAGRFELYRHLHSGEGVAVPLAPEYEATVLQALSQHERLKLRVVGTGAFTADGVLVKFTTVARVEGLDVDVNNLNLWQRIDALAANVPDSAWDSVASDAAENHDAYL